MKRGFAGNHVPLLPAMIEVAAQDQGEGSIHREDFEIPQSPSPTLTFVADEATTTSVGSPLRFYDAPLHESNTSRSAEDSLKLKELSELVPKLVMKIDMKSLEVALKRKSRKVILSESEGEEPDNQGRKIQDIYDDPLVSLARASMNESAVDFITPSKVSALGGHKRKISVLQLWKQLEIYHNTAKERIKTTKLNTGSSPVKSGGAEISTDKGQREGKAQMTEEDIQATKKKRLQLEQERVGLEEAARLKAQMDAEVAKQIHMDKMVAKRMQEEEELSEQQKKRRDEVQEAAKYYSEEDWNTIRAKLEASAELTKILQGENVSEDDFAKKVVDMTNQKKKYYAEQKAKAKRDKPMTQAQQRDYMRTFIKNQSTSLYSQGWTMVQLKKLTFKELKQEFKKLIKCIERIVPMRSEERIKRPGIELEQESSKKQKTIGSEEVPVVQENVEEPVIVKEEEIAKPVKKTGKGWKSGYYGLKPMPDEVEVLEEINVNVVTRRNGSKRYRANALGYYVKEDNKMGYQEKRPSLEEKLNMFMAESTKKDKENTDLIMEVQACTQIAIRKNKATLKAIEHIYALDTFDALGYNNVQDLQDESIDIMEIDTDLFCYELKDDGIPWTTLDGEINRFTDEYDRYRNKKYNMWEPLPTMSQEYMEICYRILTNNEEEILNSIDLNGTTRNTTRLRLFCFSLRDQAINWLDHLPAGSISNWDDLTTLPHHGLDIWLQVQIFYDHVDYTTQMAIDYVAGRRHRKLRPKEAWETIEDLAQHKEEEWNNLIFFKKESLDYIDAILKQELESMECRVESLMRNEVLLEYEVGFTFPKGLIKRN
ncbi:hypothetical protein Tco_0344509 [Tanacetum coccineum]